MCSLQISWGLSNIYQVHVAFWKNYTAPVVGSRRKVVCAGSVLFRLKTIWIGWYPGSLSLKTVWFWLHIIRVGFLLGSSLFGTVWLRLVVTLTGFISVRCDLSRSNPHLRTCLKQLGSGSMLFGPEWFWLYVIWPCSIFGFNLLKVVQLRFNIP